MAHLTLEEFDIAPILQRLGDLGHENTLPRLLAADSARSTGQGTIDLIANSLLPSILSDSGMDGWDIQSNTMDDMLNLVELSLLPKDQRGQVIQILMENRKQSIISMFDDEAEQAQLPQPRRSFEIKEQLMTALADMSGEATGLQPIKVVVVKEDELMKAESKEAYLKAILGIDKQNNQSENGA